MKKLLICLIGLALALLGVGSDFGCAGPTITATSTPAATPKAKVSGTPTLKWAGAGVTGATGGQGIAISATIANFIPDKVLVAYVPLLGSTETLREIADGRVDVGVVAAKELFWLYSGTEEWGQKYGARKDMRLMLFSTSAPFHYIVNADSDIKTLADLKGKTISAYPKTGMPSRVAVEVLANAGFDPYKDARVTHQATYAACYDMFRDGKAEACATAVGVPAALVTELAQVRKLRFIHPDEAFINKALKADPSLAKVVIPGGSYKGQPEDVVTLAVPSYHATTTALDEALAYEVEKCILTNWDYALKTSGMMGQITKERIQEMYQNFPVPFHNGALKALKEAGWIK